jgi:hypothetical protein
MFSINKVEMYLDDSLLGYSAVLVEVDRRFRSAYCLRRQAVIFILATLRTSLLLRIREVPGSNLGPCDRLS